MLFRLTIGIYFWVAFANIAAYAVCMSEPVVCKNVPPNPGKYLGCCVFNGKASTMHWEVNGKPSQSQCARMCIEKAACDSAAVNAGIAPLSEAEQDCSGLTAGSTNTIQCFGYVQGLDQRLKKDPTEGFAAFDSDHFDFVRNGTNLDLGGGAFDHNSRYLKECYGVTNSVYDPFGRDAAHNKNVLKKPFENGSNYDSVTVISVLNVIPTPSERTHLIQLSKAFVKPGGKVYFRIYEGDRSGKMSGFQNNRKTKAYLKEIQRIFGSSQVTLYDQENAIVAQRSKTLQSSED